MTKICKLCRGLVLHLFVAGAFYAWHALPDPGEWERGYSQVEEGDSQQQVLEILGKPSEIKDCYRQRYSGNPDLYQKCAKEYWYIAFMQEWVYVIDDDGTVIAKWHSVSP